MASTYKVKKGDTLSGIAKQLGVSQDQLTGYRSGNPDLIYEGESINVGGGKNAESDAYVDEVKAQLGDDGSGKEDDVYGSSKYKADLEDAKKKRDEAYSSLKQIESDTFESEYDKRGLSKKKERISEIDSEIAAARQERDDAIAKVRSNPGLSAAQMTGDIKKLADYQNGIINNKIQERNSVASEYNTELDEIDSIVSRAVNDANLDYKYYDSAVKESQGLIDAYQAQLADELEAEREDKKFYDQLENAYNIATLRGSGSKSAMTLVRDPRTGDPLYWFNPDTMEIQWVDAGDDTGGGGDSYDDIQAGLDARGGDAKEKDFKWYNPLTWF